MPGHDRTRIVGIEDNELIEFVCGICHDVFRQTYCKDCINEWLNRNKTCPNDREPLTRDGLNDGPRVLVNLIDKMRIKCQYSDRGCQVITTLAQSEHHAQTCQFRSCQVCGAINLGDQHDCIAYLLQENSRLKNGLKASTNDDEAVAIDLICKAKGCEAIVMSQKSILPLPKLILLGILEEAIGEFDREKHTLESFVNCIRNGLTKQSKML